MSLNKMTMARVGTPDFKKQVLEPNHMLVQDEQMSHEDWSKIAFSLGIPAANSSKANASARRVAQKVRRRQHVSPKQLLEYLGPVILTARKDHFSICHKTFADFHHDAIPNGASLAARGSESNRHLLPATGMLSVTPAMTFGYQPGAFSQWHRDLQVGIIPDLQGEPCDLGKISQIVPDVFWPFLVVEMAEDSRVAAQQRCAVAAAACNNALDILAKATYQTQEGANSHYLSNWHSTKAAKSFSLAIHNKEAALYVHHLSRLPDHVMKLIRTYRLDDEQDMEALIARIQSILVWAEHCRLPAILELLENFDRRVNGPVSQHNFYDDDIPASQQGQVGGEERSQSRDSESSGTKQKGRLRARFQDRFLTWSKYLPAAMVSPLHTPWDEKAW